jgi:hypothetical protein
MLVNPWGLWWEELTGSDLCRVDADGVQVAGRWDVEVQYEVGSAKHKLFLTPKGSQLAGSHQGWAFEGELTGRINGDRVEFRSVLPAGGQRLNYSFTGQVTGDSMSGDLELGEYGRAKWSARRHSVPQAG